MNEVKLYDLYEFKGNIEDESEVNSYIQECNKFYRNKIKSKLKFNGYPIDFGKHQLENGLYQQFIHISGFLEKDDNFFKPRPCKKDIYIKKCNNCVKRKYVNRINAQDRYFCFYRCEYMTYIINIFKLINVKKMDNIDIYEEDCYENKKMRKRKLIHIRYIDENVYYYILLEDVSVKGYYSFVCGFPIFNEKVKMEKNKIFGKIKKRGV